MPGGPFAKPDALRARTREDRRPSSAVGYGTRPSAFSLGNGVASRFRPATPMAARIEDDGSLEGTFAAVVPPPGVVSPAAPGASIRSSHASADRRLQRRITCVSLGCAPSLRSLLPARHSRTGRGRVTETDEHWVRTGDWMAPWHLRAPTRSTRDRSTSLACGLTFVRRPGLADWPDPATSPPRSAQCPICALAYSALMASREGS